MAHADTKWIQYLAKPTQTAEHFQQDPYGVRPVNSSEQQAQVISHTPLSPKDTVAELHS